MPFVLPALAAIGLWLTHHKLRRLHKSWMPVLEGVGCFVAVLLALCFAGGVWGMRSPYKGDGAATTYALSLCGSALTVACAATLATGYAIILRWRWRRAFCIALCELFIVSVGCGLFTGGLILFDAW